MLGRPDKKSPVPNPPSSRRIARFVEHGGCGPGEDLGQLRLDLDGPVRSPWNRQAARCFRRNFQKSGLYRSWPKSLIEEAFLRHTITIRSHYYQQMGVMMDPAATERRVRCARKNRLNTVSLWRLGQVHVTQEPAAGGGSETSVRNGTRPGSVPRSRRSTGRRRWHEWR